MLLSKFFSDCVHSIIRPRRILEVDSKGPAYHPYVCLLPTAYRLKPGLLFVTSKLMKFCQNLCSIMLYHFDLFFKLRLLSRRS